MKRCCCPHSAVQNADFYLKCRLYAFSKPYKGFERDLEQCAVANDRNPSSKGCAFDAGMPEKIG